MLELAAGLVQRDVQTTSSLCTAPAHRILHKHTDSQVALERVSRLSRKLLGVSDLDDIADERP